MNRMTKDDSKAGCKYSPHPLVSVLFTMFAIAAFAGRAQAQGSRKDDIVFNAQGRPMAGATVRVCTSTATGQPCTPLAQVYSDSALTQALANPLSADGLGNYNFYALPGRYMIELSGPGITTKQIPNVILPSDPSSPTFTSVTTTSGISAFSLSLTGNLTVNGSTAVAGSLTVGGLPVPTANQDNQWTAGQRFKGPIPWRDISGYMPAGGCSSATPNFDPQTTGTISSGTSTLTLASARDFKNGCGIAVLNAGPTSTLAAPNQGCSIASIARAANVVTVTCAAANNIPVGAFDHLMGIQITGVTDSSYNGTFDVGNVADTTHFTYPQTAGNSSSSGGTATMQFGYAHGLVGATTYNYKVSAVDAAGGMSPASAAIPITNGNATLTTSNYNWINFGVASAVDPRSRPDIVPHEWVIYSDKGLGGAYSCVGVAFTNAYSDFGLPMPCPAFAPATPPASATAQVLNTIISAGGGTTTLTLSGTASNTATTQNVYHDESSFLNSCINDDAADRISAGFPDSVGAYGCYVPAGNYYLNGPLATDTVSAAGTTIYAAGSLYLDVFPWYVSKPGYFIKGLGESGIGGSFSHANTTELHVSASLAAAVVLRGVSSFEFSGFTVNLLRGHGIWAGTVAYLVAPSAYRFDNDILNEISGGGGAPLVLDNNVIGVWAYNSSFSASNAAAGLPSIYLTGTNWNGSNSCCMYFEGISTQFRGIKADAPGGNGTGGGLNSVYIHNWVNESLGASELALVVHDSGPNAPGATSGNIPFSSLSVHNVNNSDAANGASAYTLLEELGTPLGFGSSVDVISAGSFGGLLSCGPNNAAVCNDRPSLPGTILNSSAFGGTWGGQLNVTPLAIHAELPLLLKQSYSAGGSGQPAWAQVLPPPSQFQVTGTGAGSLAAATYCMAVEGKDAQATPGLTLATNTLCQTVGASSSINLQWTQGGTGSLNQAYSGFRFLYCSTGGSSCVPNNFVPDLAASGNPVSFTFTSTAGSSATTLNTTSSAYLSWLYWDRGGKSCLFCTSSAGGLFWQLGIGDLNPPSGSKLSVAGGSINAPSYTTTTNCAANSASPAACGSAASGVFAVPTTTTTYTVNTTAVTVHSRIFLRSVLDNTDIPSSPTCNSPLLGSGEYAPSARVAGTSFTFTMTSTTGVTCFQYWIVN